MVVVLCLMACTDVLVIWTVNSSGPESYTATITVDPTAKTSGRLGPQYTGLSIESAALNSGTITDGGDLARLLSNLGRSVLRFGGDSADASFTRASPSALRDLAALASASGWSVLYTENEGEYNSARVMADARAVEDALGARLFAFACGNEPDVYPHNHLRPPGYTAADYLGQAATCLRAIREAVPSGPLEGPDTAGNREWFSAYAKREAGTVSWLGQHYYPMGCASPGGQPAALLATLLSPRLAASEAKTLAWYVAAAKTADRPLLITETNSACGGGIPGLSDAYASALWVIDYLLTGAEVGVQGMYFHTGQLDSYCLGYAVLCETRPSSFSAQPVYYGLLFAHLLGTGRFLRAKVSMSPRREGNVAAFALKTARGGLRLMVENLSPEQLHATLRAGNDSGSATVLSLTGPSLLATSGVRIQGAPVGPNGNFDLGPPDTVQCAAQGCPVALAPYSAALVTIGNGRKGLNPGTLLVPPVPPQG